MLHGQEVYVSYHDDRDILAKHRIARFSYLGQKTIKIMVGDAIWQFAQTYRHHPPTVVQDYYAKCEKILERFILCLDG